ncbi:MAG: hypothetical protein ACRC0X_07825 [Brevinema sp.]
MNQPTLKKLKYTLLCTECLIIIFLIGAVYYFFPNIIASLYQFLRDLVYAIVAPSFMY